MSTVQLFSDKKTMCVVCAKLIALKTVVSYPAHWRCVFSNPPRNTVSIASAFNLQIFLLVYEGQSISIIYRTGTSKREYYFTAPPPYLLRISKPKTDSPPSHIQNHTTCPSPTTEPQTIQTDDRPPYKGPDFPLPKSTSSPQSFNKRKAYWLPH